MTSQEAIEIRSALLAMRAQVRWLSWGVLVLSFVHGPEILKIIISGV